MNNVAYLLALHSVDGLGPIRLKALLEYFKDPKVAWEADIKQIREIGIPQPVVDLLVETRKNLEPTKMLQDLEKQGIKWTTIFDDSYPKKLLQIYDPPVVIYYKGEFLPKDDKAIAIVGTRKMSGYGKMVTNQFATALSGYGFTIVSGLARGVDSEAHWSAIKSGGRTIAVLGGGLNQIYPPENIVLTDQIVGGKGVVMSEFPPEYPSMPGNFPARNRVISGLSLAVLVTEAASDSGSLITARLALEQGRDVFAIPGPINSDLSKGPTELIRDGARIVSEPGEILEELGMEEALSTMNQVSREDLSQEEQKILEYLKNENRHIDEIGRNLNFSAAQVSGILLKMEISGLVRNLGGGVYCRV